MRFLPPVFAVYLVAITAAQTPDPQTTFRSNVDLVRLDVSVLDKDRLPIRGLTAADFTVLEDRRVQPIVAFDAVDLPQGKDETTASIRNVADAAAGRRVIVIILKDVRVPLDPSAIRATKRIAHDVVDQMGPQDVAAIVYAFDQAKSQTFTTDRTALLTAIDRFTVSFADQSLIANAFAASERGKQSDPYANGKERKPGSAAEVCPGDRCVTTALQNAAAMLRDSRGGRKTVVLVSPAQRTATMERSHATDLRPMFDALQQANVNVYQFDPRGLLVAPLVHSDLFVNIC